MTGRLRAAVIVTRDRPDQFHACLDAIAPQVDQIAVVAHAQPGYVLPELFDVRERRAGVGIGIAPYSVDTANISMMWNIGLQMINDCMQGLPYDVAVLNDDAIVPDGWFDTVTHHMHQLGCAAGSTAPTDVLQTIAVHTKPGPINLHTRMTGYAFILNSLAQIRANEDIRWWLSDDWIDWTARERGGTVVIPGHRVAHPEGGGTPVVGELADWFEEDKIKFQDRWGALPW